MFIGSMLLDCTLARKEMGFSWNPIWILHSKLPIDNEITGQTCPLSFKGSPYWMAPEVIRNSKGCSLAVDIWSIGCTVLEMALSKPPWSQYEGIAAMFKIGNTKELPTIPEHLPTIQFYLILGSQRCYQVQ